MNGVAPGSVDRVSINTVDVGRPDVTDNSILAGLGLIDVYDPLSRGANPVGNRGVFGASAGEPNTLNFDPNGGFVQTEFKLVGGLVGQELAASLAMGDMFSSPKLQRKESAARELDIGSQPSEYPARSGVAGGGNGQRWGEYPDGSGVSHGVHANPIRLWVFHLWVLVQLHWRKYLRTVLKIRLFNISLSYRITL